jgi:hypothetical protein
MSDPLNTYYVETRQASPPLAPPITYSSLASTALTPQARLGTFTNALPTNPGEGNNQRQRRMYYHILRPPHLLCQ